MASKTTILLGLGAMILGGCYSGVDDAGDGGISNRYGEYCYASSDSGTTTKYKATASASGWSSSKASVDDGFTLTMKADPATASGEQMIEILDHLRFKAVSTAQFFIQTSCGGGQGFGQVVNSCKNTCEQQGLVMEQAVLCEPECKLVKDDNGNENIECAGALPPNAEEALSKPWSGQTNWVFQTGEGLTLVLPPPEIHQGQDGLTLVSQVHVTGFCLCACTVG